MSRGMKSMKQVHALSAIPTSIAVSGSVGWGITNELSLAGKQGHPDDTRITAA